MQMSPQDYIVEFVSGECALCFSSRDNYAYILLGVAFMRNFYAVHDMTNARFGYAPLVNS